MLETELGKILETLLNHGFEPPLYWATIAVNGAMAMGRYILNTESGDLDCQIIASHDVGGTFGIPINMMFTDRDGDAARVVTGRSEEPEVIFN
ncbi:MAG: hypothetical protein A2157_03790 [Deltaproteobacteria bacterium RBG_16_47_11]|nr:MAG: hypothetical protein A2157_03790 [Deltaproteobacteria bacterium RBG_16_47_11]